MNQKRLKIVVWKEGSYIENFENDVNKVLDELEEKGCVILNINLWGRGQDLQAHIIYSK